MSKYSYFQKKGRPNATEKKWLDKIEKISHLIDEEDAEAYFQNNDVCRNADDLERFYNHLEGNTQEPVNNDIEMDNEIEDIEIDGGDDIPTSEPKVTKQKTPKTDVHDPFSEPVVEREYTNFGIGGDIGETYEVGGDEFDIEPEIEEPAYASSFNKGGSGQMGGHQQQPPVQQPIEEIHNYDDFQPFDSGGSSGGGNTEYQDLSPKQKRKMAEETAEAILKTYARFVPIPFKLLSKFNMSKLERMEMSNELNLKMVVQVGGVTVMDYVEEVNEQVDEIFTITEEMQNEIREPLVDVLMENEIALTPTQRLIIAVGGQLFQMGAMAWQYNKSNKQALEQFKKFHQEQRGGVHPNMMNNANAYQNAQVMQQQQQMQNQQAQQKPSDIEFTVPPDLKDYINGTTPPPQEEVTNDESVTIEEVPYSGV